LKISNIHPARFFLKIIPQKLAIITTEVKSATNGIQREKHRGQDFTW